jgi:hypothetical protein
LGGLDVDGMKLLRLIVLNKYGIRFWTGFMQLRIGVVVSTCKLSNEYSGYIKGRDFLTS